MALESIQPLTEMTAGNLHGGKGRPARKADNLTAICEPIRLHGVVLNSSTGTLPFLRHYNQIKKDAISGEDKHNGKGGRRYEY
jgi:hypothetical protein